MKRICVLVFFGVITLACMYKAATSDVVAVAFVYVLGTAISAVLGAHFTFCKDELK